MKNNQFLVGNILREVRNGRLNCNNSNNETHKDSNDNGTYVKKIRKGNQTLPYVSAQWQKKNIKDVAETLGNNISSVRSISSKEAVSEGNPYKNYDEDVMGFMIAQSIKITDDEYAELDNDEQKLWTSMGKNKGYKRNISSKRRANLMLSPLQAIGHTRLVNEFSTRETDDTPLLYSKEVYASDMSSGFILDIAKVGKFTISDNPNAYRDFSTEDVKAMGLEILNDTLVLDLDTKRKRVVDTIKGLQFMTTKTTMANNLEDMSAKFMIMAEYSIGNAVFNNIFEDNKLKVEYLKQAIEENEDFRMSKIYIGCRDEYFRQDGKYLVDIIRQEFGNDDRFIVGNVNDIVSEYIKELSM